MTWDDVIALGAALPGVEVDAAYGRPALKLRGKHLCSWREDVGSLVLPVSFDEREMLMEVDPETFWITDHYRGWPSVLARLDRVDGRTVHRLLEQAWRAKALKTTVAAYDAARAIDASARG